MKVKTRKSSQRASVNNHASGILRKKGRKDRNTVDQWETAANLLITSSPKSGSQLVSNTCTFLRGKTMKGSDTGHDNDACQYLRLAVPGMKGTSDPKRVSTALDTIFSPVFHIFKGDAVNNYPCNVELTDTTVEKTKKKDMKPVFRSDGTAIEMTETPESSVMDASSPLGINHANSDSNIPEDEALDTCTTFVVGGNCLGWSLEVENRDPEQMAERIEDGLHDSEDSSLFLAIQQTNALDDSHASGQVDTIEDEDDFNDFDPYLFIKHLPDLSELLLSSRPPIVIPKQTQCCPPVTLVLDLDETLVHSTLEHCEDADFTFPVTFNSQEYTIHVRCRPHLQAFMEKVAQMFEVIVFTASQSVYADQLLNMLDPKKQLIRHRVFRDSCIFFEGNYLKDLTILGRDLSKVVIVDNSPQAFGFQVDNGIPIESWFEDKSDSALMGLIPFLETLVDVDDVRPIIARKFDLRQRVAAAMDPSFVY